jgi:hypothetical protein
LEGLVELDAWGGVGIRHLGQHADPRAQGFRPLRSRVPFVCSGWSTSMVGARPRFWSDRAKERSDRACAVTVHGSVTIEHLQGCEPPQAGRGARQHALLSIPDGLPQWSGPAPDSGPTERRSAATDRVQSTAQRPVTIEHLQGCEPPQAGPGARQHAPSVYSGWSTAVVGARPRFWTDGAKGAQRLSAGGKNRGHRAPTRAPQARK